MNNLPVINDLYKDDVTVLSKQNDLNRLLNEPPKDNWVKIHPMFKTVKYIPIERIEWLLTSIFVKWRVEVIDTQLMANSSVVTVRLHYRDPVTGDWDWQDGIGAAPLQTDKGAGATDWAKIKNDAVMKSVPAAESYAIKDAAEKLGKLFGKDLNRADKILYDTLSGKFTNNLQKEVVNALDKYKGEDKELLQDMCAKKVKAKEFTEDFAKDILEQIK